MYVYTYVHKQLTPHPHVYTYTASMMNHSCKPNVQRTYVGDMFVCRATQALPAREWLSCSQSPYPISIRGFL